MTPNLQVDFSERSIAAALGGQFSAAATQITRSPSIDYDGPAGPNQA